MAGLVKAIVTGQTLAEYTDVAIADATDDVAEIGASYDATKAAAVVTAYNDLATEFNSLIANLRSNGLIK